MKVIGIGSKAEMIELLDGLDKPEDSDEADEGEPTQSLPVIPIQRSRPTGQHPAKSPRKAAKSSSYRKVSAV